MPRFDKVTKKQEFLYYVFFWFGLILLRQFFIHDYKFILLLSAVVKVISISFITVLAGTSLDSLIVNNEATDHLPSLKYWWNQRIQIFGNGALYGLLLLNIGYMFQYMFHVYWNNLSYINIFLLGSSVSIALLIEPMINLFIRLFAWKYVGKDAVVKLNYWNGSFEVKHFDASQKAIELAGNFVLTPSAFRVEHFKFSLPWRYMFRGTKLLISGVEIKVRYVDPHVAMYNVDGAIRGGHNSAFLDSALTKKREIISKNTFLAKQSKMISIVNQQTILINQKLKDVKHQIIKARERRSHRYLNNNNNQSNNNDQSNNNINLQDDISNEDLNQNKIYKHPFWVYLVDDIIADFNLNINNIKIELLELPGELNENYKHNHVSMQFSIPEISIQTNVVIKKNIDKGEKENDAKKMSLEEKIEYRHQYARHHTKLVVSIGPLVSYSPLLKEQPKYHHSVINNLTIQINLDVPPPMSGIVMNKVDHIIPEDIDIKIFVSDFETILTPDSVRPLLRLSTAFSTYNHLVLSAERVGRNYCKIVSWTQHDEQQYIKAYRRIHDMEKGGGSTTATNAPPYTEEQQQLDMQLLKKLELSAVAGHEILDARHRSLNWKLPKAGDTIIRGTRTKVVRRADRDAFLNTSVDSIVEKMMENYYDSEDKFDYDPDDTRCRNSSKKKKFMDTIIFSIHWGKISLSIGSNAKPKHFSFELSKLKIIGRSFYKKTSKISRCLDLNFTINTISLHDDSQAGAVVRGTRRSGITNIIDFVIKNKTQAEILGLNNDLFIHLKQEFQEEDPMNVSLHIKAHTLHLRIILVFDRINTLLALLSDLQVPDYETLLQAPGSAAAVAAAHAADEADEMAFTGNGQLSGLHKQAYKTKQVGLLLGGMPLHLEFKTGILLALPEFISEDYNQISVILQKCEIHSDILSGIPIINGSSPSSSYASPEESVVIDIVDFETKNAALRLTENGSVKMETSQTCISEIENENVDIHLNIVGKKDVRNVEEDDLLHPIYSFRSHGGHGDDTNEWIRDVNISIGRFTANCTPSVIASLHRVNNIKIEADHYRAHLDLQKRNEQNEIRESVEKIKKRDQIKLIHHKFDIIDHDRSGELDKNEFLEFIKRHDMERDKMNGKMVMPCELGYIVSRLVDRIDTDGNGSVSWYEFSNSREVKAALGENIGNGLDHGNLVNLHGGEYSQCYLTSLKGQEMSKNDYINRNKGFLSKSIGSVMKHGKNIGNVGIGIAGKVGRVGRAVAGSVISSTSSNLKSDDDFKKHKVRKSYQSKIRKLKNVRAVSVLNAHQNNFLISRLKMIKNHGWAGIKNDFIPKIDKKYPLDQEESKHNEQKSRLSRSISKDSDDGLSNVPIELDEKDTLFMWKMFVQELGITKEGFQLDDMDHVVTDNDDDDDDDVHEYGEGKEEKQSSSSSIPLGQRPITLGAQLPANVQRKLVRLVCDYNLAQLIWESYFVTLLPDEMLFDKKKWLLKKYMYMDGPTSIGDALFETALDNKPRIVKQIYEKINLKLRAHCTLAGLCFRLIDPIDADLGADIEICLGMTDIKMSHTLRVADDESSKHYKNSNNSKSKSKKKKSKKSKKRIDNGSLSNIDSRRSTIESETKINLYDESDEEEEEEEANEDLTDGYDSDDENNINPELNEENIISTWKLVLCGDLRITYLNVNSEGVEPLLETMHFACHYPSFASSLKEEDSDPRGSAMGLAISAIRLNISACALKLLTRWLATSNAGDDNQERIFSNDTSEDSNEVSDAKICVLVDNQLGQNAYVYISESLESLENKQFERDYPNFKFGESSYFDVSNIENGLKNVLGLEEPDINMDDDGDHATLYVTSKRGELEESVQKSLGKEGETKSSKRKKKKRLHSVYGNHNLMINAGAINEEIIHNQPRHLPPSTPGSGGSSGCDGDTKTEGKKSSLYSRKREDGKRSSMNQQNLRDWLHKQCMNNTMAHGDRSLVPVVSEIGISERFRRQFDKSQLYTAFQKADEDGSGFLEEDELLGIITGEVLAEMAFGENKVNQTIYRVVHSHCRSKRKVSFSDFLSIFEKIKAELRVPDVLYLSIDLMNNARNKHQFIMVNAERSVVGWPINIEDVYTQEISDDEEEEKKENKSDARIQKFTWNQKNKLINEMCVLVVDMTNPARGKAILRSNVCVVADMELLVEVTTFNGETFTLERSPLGEKVYLPLKTVQFRIAPVPANSGTGTIKWTKPIYLYMGYDPIQEKTDYRNCLTVTRTHTLLEHALDSFGDSIGDLKRKQQDEIRAKKRARRQQKYVGKNKKNVISGRRRNKRKSFIETESHRPDRIFDFVYTVTALSTISNILPYPIDVTVRTVPFKGKDKWGRKEKRTSINHSKKERLNSTVYVAKAIGVGESQHVPNPIGPNVINSITLTIRPSPMTLKQYYEANYNKIKIPVIIEKGIPRGYEKTIFEDFETFNGWSPFKLYDAALEKAREKCGNRNSLDKWENFATDSVINILYAASKHSKKCPLRSLNRHLSSSTKKCHCNVLKIIHRGSLYSCGSKVMDNTCSDDESNTTEEEKEDIHTFLNSNDNENQIKEALRFILENPNLPIDSDEDAMRAAGLKAPKWSEPVEFMMKYVDKKGFNSRRATLKFHEIIDDYNTRQHFKKIQIDERDVSITMNQLDIEPKRRNFWKGEKVCLNKPNSEKIYIVHEREYLDEYDNWILNLYDPFNHGVLHVQTLHTNIYLVHDDNKINNKYSAGYNFEISSYYFIANRTGLNLEYNFTHKGKSYKRSGLPRNVSGCDLHARMNNYENLMVPKVKKFIKSPPLSEICHFDPPFKNGTARSTKPTQIQTRICPTESIETMSKNPKYNGIPTLLLETRSRQIDPSNHLLLFNPHSTWSQKEIITNVGYDMPLIGKAIGGKGNGKVDKYSKLKNLNGGNIILNKGDDIGVDNYIICNVRSMMGKLSKNIIVQLEAPIHIENKLNVPIYLRLTSTGSEYNDHHPSDETYGLPVIEVQPSETAKCFVDPLLPLIEMGIRDPYIPDDVSIKTGHGCQKWPESAQHPIIWGKPIDTSLDNGRLSVQCETRQYNRDEIVETEVMGMYDASGAIHVTVRSGHAKYLIENRSTRVCLYYSELDEGSVTPEAEKQIKSCKDASGLSRIIGYRHHYFTTQKKKKLECLDTRSFTFNARSPKYLNIGIRGLEHKSNLNKGDIDPGSNGVLTIDVEVTGQTTPFVVCLPGNEDDSGNREDNIYLHLILEIYTDGVHNVISIADAMDQSNKDMCRFSHLRNLNIMEHHNLSNRGVNGNNDGQEKRGKLQTSSSSTSSSKISTSPPSSPTLKAGSLNLNTPPSRKETSRSWSTFADQSKWEGQGYPGMTFNRMSYQFGSIILVLIDDVPRELLALSFEEISCEWSISESAFSIEHCQIDDMTVGSLTPIVLEPSNRGYNSGRNEAWRLKCRKDHQERTISHDKNSGLPQFVHTRLEPWLSCRGTKAPSTGMGVYEECTLDIGDLALNIDLKFILADVMSFSGNIMPELFDMLGYPKLGDVDATLELLLWSFFQDAGFAINYGMTAERFFKKVTVMGCKLNLRLLTDAFMNTRSEQIDSLGDWAKGIVKMLGPSMELSPTIKFDKQIMQHKKSNWLGLLSSYVSLAFQNTRQVMFKLLTGFSSMKMFGNIGGLTEQFIETTKTSHQMAKQGYYGRAGLRVGQSFFSGIFRCMGSTAEAGTQCGGSISGYSRNTTFQQSPRHVIHGTAQGLYSGANVLARGITGIITRPIKGAKKNGVAGAAKGFGQGVVGVVIMIPLAYIGFAERFYKGMGATFQAKGKLSVCGTRRPPRVMMSQRKRNHLKIEEARERLLSKKSEEETKKNDDNNSDDDCDDDNVDSDSDDDDNHKIKKNSKKKKITEIDKSSEMARLFDVEDASLAAHITMRIHKLRDLKLSNGSSRLERSKIVVRVNLYTQAEIKETLISTFTKLKNDIDVFDDNDNGIRKKKEDIPWIKLQSYETSPGLPSTNRRGEVEFLKDDFTFHLDRMAPTSEDLQQFLIRGCSLQTMKIKIKVYEYHSFRHKTLLCERELNLMDLMSFFPVRDPEPFKEKHDSSTGAKPNMAWTHITDLSQDKRRSHDRVCLLKRKRSTRIIKGTGGSSGRGRGSSYSLKDTITSNDIKMMNSELILTPGNTPTGGDDKYSTETINDLSSLNAAIVESVKDDDIHQNILKFNDDEMDLDDDNHSKEMSVIQRQQSAMQRQQSARKALNTFTNIGIARKKIVGGKRIPVKEWDENFWKHASEDPQLSVFETEGDWLQLNSKINENKVITISEDCGQRDDNLGEQRQQYDMTNVPDWDAESDATSIVTGANEQQIIHHPTMKPLQPEIQISGFIFRYRDHSVRMALNKVK